MGQPRTEAGTAHPARQSRLRARLALLGIGLLGGLAIAEGGLRLARLPHTYRKPVKPAQFLSRGADADGRVTYVNQPSAHLRFVYDGNPRGYFDAGNVVDHVTNSRGFRGPEFADAKPAGTFRLICLGDSFTFGEGVRFEDTYPAATARLLASRLTTGPRIESVNLGVGGYNTADELRALDEIALPAQPDLVVLGYVLNDAEPPLFTYEAATGVRRNPRETLVPENVSDPEPPANPLFWLRSAQLVWRAVQAREQTAATIAYYQSINDPASPGWIDSMRALHAIIDRCRARHIPVVVMVFPVLLDLDSRYPFAETHARLAREVSEDGGLFADLLPRLQGRRAADLWVHPTDQHPNEIVDRVAAETLADAIAARGLIVK